MTMRLANISWISAESSLKYRSSNFCLIIYKYKRANDEWQPAVLQLLALLFIEDKAEQPSYRLGLRSHEFLDFKTIHFDSLCNILAKPDTYIFLAYTNRSLIKNDYIFTLWSSSHFFDNFSNSIGNVDRDIFISNKARRIWN